MRSSRCRGIDQPEIAAVDHGRSRTCTDLSNSRRGSTSSGPTRGRLDRRVSGGRSRRPGTDGTPRGRLRTRSRSGSISRVGGSILTRMLALGSTTHTKPSPAAIRDEVKPRAISATSWFVSGSMTPTDVEPIAERPESPRVSQRISAPARSPRGRRRDDERSPSRCSTTSFEVVGTAPEALRLELEEALRAAEVLEGETTQIAIANRAVAQEGGRRVRDQDLTAVG